MLNNTDLGKEARVWMYAYTYKFLKTFIKGINVEAQI